MKHAEAVDEPRPGLPRVLEVVLSLAGLVVVFPLLAFAAVAIAAESPGSPFFHQQRVGRGGRLFMLHKLRTMRAAGGEGFEPGVRARVTKVGRLLRRLKLDEVPQLLNVLKGDMSFVGPRPEVPAFVDPSDPLWRTVLCARPGMTDPVSLGLRDEESLLAEWLDDRERFYREVLQPFKLRGYVQYLRHRTAITDLKVLLKTVLVAAGILDWPRVQLQDLAVSAKNDDESHKT